MYESVATSRPLVEVGSLAEWAGVFVTFMAVVVAGIALWHSHQANARSQDAIAQSDRANAIAQSAYVADVQARRVAQARLVYPEHEGSWVVRAGEELPPPRPGGSNYLVGGLKFPPSPPAGPYVFAVDVLVVELSVCNDSNEPIATFFAQLYDESTRALLPEWGHARGVKPDTRSAAIRLIAPTGGPYLPEISFRDAAGVWWSRRWYGPVQELDDARRATFEQLDNIWAAARESRGPDQPWP